MADVKCHRCGEPWEIDTFHDIAQEQGISFDQAMRNFRVRGCESTHWTGRCEKSYANGEIIAALADALGDDCDGLAAMLEDFGL